MDIGSARTALEQGRYDDAIGLLGAAPPAGATATEWFEVRAGAAYGAGDYDGAVLAWENLHERHLENGRRADAARAAVMAAMLLLVDSGLMSAVRGWMRRAERLLDDDPTPVHALVAAVAGYERFFCGDISAATPHARLAIELGERFGVRLATVMGLTATGRMTMLRGDIEVGLAQLDEVAVLLMSPDVDPLTRGIMSCELVCAAQNAARTDRAREWTDQMERGAAEAPGSVRGRCRLHRAELLRVSGPLDEAEREARAAGAELRPWMRREFGWPLVELGTICLRRGDLAAAERYFRDAEDHGWPPHPGLALVRLERGDVDGAARLVASAIAHPVEPPSKEMPPFGELRMVPLLDAQAEIALAARDLVVADGAAARLDGIARRFGGPDLMATAALAAAGARLLHGDTSDAAALAQRALAEFVGLGAPFETARARGVAALAHAWAGDHDLARLDLAAAERAYRRYGAIGRADAVARRLDPPDEGCAATVTEHRHGVLRQDGDGWFTEFVGHQARVKDLKGFRYLHRLVSEPAREFHVLDLVAAESAHTRGEASAPRGTVTGTGEAGIEVLDHAARDAYRRRLVDVDDDIDDATRCHDLGRLAKAESDREYLLAELKAAVGLGGRTRIVGGSSERARTSVTRSIRYALRELGTRQELLAEHLTASVRTGTYCSYRPDPSAVVDWEL